LEDLEVSDHDNPERREPLIASVKDTAFDLGVSEDTVKRLAARGELQYVELSPRRGGITTKSKHDLIKRGAR
jgi:hypothetical protein